LCSLSSVICGTLWFVFVSYNVHCASVTYPGWELTRTRTNVMPHVVSIAYKPTDGDQHPEKHYSRVATERATLVADRGIARDAKARPGDRQLNVMFDETVRQLNAEGFRTAPGELGEQLVIDGLSANSLALGTRLRLGDSAIIELGSPREPCARFERIQGHPIASAVGRI